MSCLYQWKSKSEHDGPVLLKDYSSVMKLTISVLSLWGRGEGVGTP